SLTYLFAEEKEDAFYSLLATPADDRITSLLHEFKYSENIGAVFEAAANNREIGDTPAEHDSAFRMEVKGTYKRLYGEFEAYNIGEFFVPVAEGNAKFLTNNREGYRGKGRVRPAKWLMAGGEYEQYDSDDTAAQRTDVTKRGNAFVAVSAGSAASLKYTYSKMTVTTGVVSERDQVAAVFRIREVGDLNNTVISVNWNDMNYENDAIIVNTNILGLSFKTHIRCRLGLSAGYTDTDTESPFANTVTESEMFYFGLDWQVRPGRLSLSSRFEVSDTEGMNIATGLATVNQEEWRLKTMLRYVRTDTYTYLVGYDVISHDNNDPALSAMSYDQNIFRSGIELKF
ncbi:hypothetical protein ACFLQK_02570, partial [bacterium]